MDMLTPSSGPSSSLYPNLPTSCFTDVILVPLASWIYFALLALAFLARRPVRATFASEDAEPGTKRAGHSRTRARAVARSVAYYFVLLASVAMLSIEVARLSTAGAGVGLLPFLYVAFVAAATVRTACRADVGLRAASAAFWVVFVVMSAVKLATVGKEANNSTYPRDHEMTDIGVEIGLAVILALLDGFRM